MCPFPPQQTQKKVVHSLFFAPDPIPDSLVPYTIFSTTGAHKHSWLPAQWYRGTSPSDTEINPRNKDPRFFFIQGSLGEQR